MENNIYYSAYFKNWSISYYFALTFTVFIFHHPICWPQQPASQIWFSFALTWKMSRYPSSRGCEQPVLPPCKGLLYYHYPKKQDAWARCSLLFHFVLRMWYPADALFMAPVRPLSSFLFFLLLSKSGMGTSGMGAARRIWTDFKNSLLSVLCTPSAGC